MFSGRPRCFMRLMKSAGVFQSNAIADDPPVRPSRLAIRCERRSSGRKQLETPQFPPTKVVIP